DVRCDQQRQSHAPVHAHQCNGRGRRALVTAMHLSGDVEEVPMRSTISFAVAALLATSMAAAAQTTKTETKIKGGHDAHMVTYTGCVRTGAETTSYMLENAVPLSQTTTVGTAGDAQTVTTWALVPDRTI